MRSRPLAGSERKRELRRRRKRRTKLEHLKGRLPKASASEKGEIARKLREMTPGAEALIASWQLVESDR
jgi:hypothetical protein